MRSSVARLSRDIDRTRTKSTGRAGPGDHRVRAGHAVIPNPNLSRAAETPPIAPSPDRAAPPARCEFPGTRRRGRFLSGGVIIMRSCALAALVALALAGPARAAMSDGVVRIGVLTDMGGSVLGQCRGRGRPGGPDGGRGFRRHRRRRAGRGRRRRSPEQDRCRLGHRPPVVRRRQGRCDHRSRILGGRPLGPADLPRQGPHLPGDRPGHPGPHRQGLLARRPATGPTTTTRSATSWPAPWCGAA